MLGQKLVVKKWNPFCTLIWPYPFSADAKDTLLHRDALKKNPTALLGRCWSWRWLDTCLLCCLKFSWSYALLLSSITPKPSVASFEWACMRYHGCKAKDLESFHLVQDRSCCLAWRISTRILIGLSLLDEWDGWKMLQKSLNAGKLGNLVNGMSACQYFYVFSSPLQEESGTTLRGKCLGLISARIAYWCM